MKSEAGERRKVRMEIGEAECEAMQAAADDVHVHQSGR